MLKIKNLKLQKNFYLFIKKKKPFVHQYYKVFLQHFEFDVC